MTRNEQISLQNDLTRLKKTFNPHYVSFSVLPAKAGSIFTFKMHMKNITTYVKRSDSVPPVPVHSIDVYFDIHSGYPRVKPTVYYGDTQWLCHVNTFTTPQHKQCTDIYDPNNSSLVELAIKTARAVVYDKNVARYDSMAMPSQKEWQQRMERSGKFPTINPTLLFTANQKRTPHHA